MMLYVENLEKRSRLELAMLLDESPSPSFGDSRARWQEPWAAGGALATAAESARVRGRARLFLIFESDKRHTWGARSVTAVAAGVLFADERPAKPLRFEVVARHVFKNIVGSDTTHAFRVIEDVAFTPDPACEEYRDSKKCHQLLGYAVPEYAVSNVSSPNMVKSNRLNLGDTPALKSGFCVVWVDHTGYSEVWFVADAPGFRDFEFGLHEYARRPYVSILMNILGFVSGPARRDMIDVAQSLLSGALPQLLALEKLCRHDCAAAEVPEGAGVASEGDDGAAGASSPKRRKLNEGVDSIKRAASADAAASNAASSGCVTKVPVQNVPTQQGTPGKSVPRKVLDSRGLGGSLKSGDPALTQDRALSNELSGNSAGDGVRTQLGSSVSSQAAPAVAGDISKIECNPANPADVKCEMVSAEPIKAAPALYIVQQTDSAQHGPTQARAAKIEEEAVNSPVVGLAGPASHAVGPGVLVPSSKSGRAFPDVIELD